MCCSLIIERLGVILCRGSSHNGNMGNKGNGGMKMEMLRGFVGCEQFKPTKKVKIKVL